MQFTRITRRITRWSSLLLTAIVAAACVWMGIRLWPRQLPKIREPEPTVFLCDGRVGIAMPTDVLMARVGDYGALQTRISTSTGYAREKPWNRGFCRFAAGWTVRTAANFSSGSITTY